MVKHSCATCLVALVLLGCLVATLIEAQGGGGRWWGMVGAAAPAIKPESGQNTFIPKPQPPKQPPKEKPPVQRPQTPSRPTTPVMPSCAVEEGVMVPCGYAEISAHECDAIGCCFDRQQCYYGKAVTVQCTKDAQFIVVVARDATLPTIDLDSITLLGEGHGCTFVDSNSGFAIYQFPVTSCGTLVKEESGIIIYENRMTSSYEVGIGFRGAITRDTTYELLFQCRYIGQTVETLVLRTVFGTLPPVSGFGHLDVVLRLGNGQCISKGCNEEMVAYSSYFTAADYPVTKVLKDPIYVDVSIIGRTDHIHLTLGRCWTTTSPNPHSLPQWDLLVNGCPFRDDRYLTTLVGVDDHSAGIAAYPSHHKRFIFKMFTFVDQTSMVPLREQVYIHCSTTVCVPDAGNDCRQPCYRTKRNVPARVNTETRIVVSSQMIVVTSS